MPDAPDHLDTLLAATQDVCAPGLEKAEWALDLAVITRDPERRAKLLRLALRMIVDVAARQAVQAVSEGAAGR